MAAAVANYTPDIPADEWAIIGEFVRAAVTDCNDGTVYSARELFKAVTRHVRWCAGTAGLPLDREVVFHPAVIGEWAILLPDPGIAGNIGRAAAVA